MSKFAELPDGTRLEFPDNTDDSVIDKVVKSHLGISATPEKSDGAKFKDWAIDKAGGAVGALTALPDYVTGAAKMAGSSLIQGGLMLAGNPAAEARPAAQQVMEEFLPSVGPAVNKLLPEGMRTGAGHGYDAMMYPMKVLTDAMALPGKGVHALTGDKNLQSSTDLAVDAALLLAPFAKKVAAPKQAPLTDSKGTPLNFNPKEVATNLETNKLIAAEEARNKAQRPLEPQGDLIGAQYGGRQAMPWDTPENSRARSPLELELVPEGERGLFGDNPRATPQEALKTTHDYPTIDFPLRQEVLEQPEIKQAIDAFRIKDAELTQVVDNAISEAVRNKAKEQRDALREEFGRGMELLGINKASDAYGRGLYEARGNETTGAVQHTYDARGGFKRDQGGYIDPTVFKEAVDKLEKYISPEIIASLRSGPDWKSRERYVLMPVDKFIESSAEGRWNEKSTGVGKWFGKEKMHSTPTMYLTKDTNTNHVQVGHEGRHRAWAMKEAGLEYIPVKVSSDLIRWSEQHDPTLFDYRKDWPSTYTTERGIKQTFPIPQDEAKLPNAGVYNNTPASTRGMGKSQEGALKIFQKSEDKSSWMARMKLGIPDITDQRLNELWQERNKQAESHKTVSKLARGIAPTTGGEIKILKITPEETLAALKASEDSKSASGGYRETFMPGGYMPMEFSNNNGYKAGIRYLKSLIETSARNSENALFAANTGIIAKLNKLETLFSPGSAKEVLKQMFEAKDNPAYEFKFTPQQAKVHEAIRGMFDSMLQDINRYLPENKQLDRLPNYIPSIHDGAFYVQVIPKGSTTSRPILYGAGNKYQLATIKKLLEVEGHKVSDIKTRGKYVNEFGDTNSVKAANYQYYLDILTDADPLVRELGQQLANITDRQAYITDGVNQRFKEYHGYQGNLGNNPLKSDRKNYYEAKKMLINTVESHHAWVAAQEAAAFGKRMIEEGVPINNQTMLRDYINHNVIGNNPKTVIDSVINSISEVVTGMDAKQTRQATARVGNIVTTFKTAMGSPIHALQNVVQPITVILPHIFKERGNFVDVVNSMTIAPMEYMYVAGIKQIGEIGKLFGADSLKILGSKEFNKKMQYALDTGVINPTIVDSSPMFDSKLANRAADFGMQGALSRPTEQAARWTVFSTMYDLHLRKGKSPEQAAQRAKEITETFMVDYGSDARARVFAEGGLVGNSMGRLQTFATNQISQTFLYLKNSAKSPADFSAAVTYLGTLAALGGITGLPFFDLFETAVNSFKSKDTDTYSLRNELRRTVGDVAVGGLWDTIGLGVSPSFASRTIGDNGLPSALGFPTVQILGQAAETAKERLDPRKDWETTPEHEKGRQLQSVTPTVFRRMIEDKYQRKHVDGKDMYVSGKTGSPVHQIRPEEITEKYNLGNIRSSERAKNADINNQKFLEQGQRREQVKKIQADISSRFYDIVYQETTPEKLKKFNEQMEKYVMLGNTDTDFKRLAEQIVSSVALGDAELQQLKNISQRDPSLKNLYQLTKEIEYMKLREAQPGIFNFGVTSSSRGR